MIKSRSPNLSPRLLFSSHLENSNDFSDFKNKNKKRSVLIASECETEDKEEEEEEDEGEKE